MNKFFSARLLLIPISIGAFLATWGGWAKLATMTGYQEVEMLGGQEWSRFNIGIVLPMTVEPFGAFAAKVAFDPNVRRWARVIAGVMAVLTLVAAGICQAVVHHLTVNGVTRAPDFVVAVTSVLPVIVLGLGGALAMLSKVHVGDAETPTRNPGTGFLGRIGNALGDAAATRAERFAETSKALAAAPAETQAGSATVSETVTPTVSQAVSQAAAETPVRDDPASSVTRVSTGQKVETATKPSRDELVRRVHELRQETPRPSYAAIADRLGISKAEAGRLGQDAAKRFGETAPAITTVPFPVSLRDAEPQPASTVPVNGHHFKPEEN